jgi:hypothetical protein
MATEATDSDFNLYIDYEREEGEPSRVFHAMGELIDAFEGLDELLAGIISEGAGTELVLKDIEAASLRAKLRSVIQGVPDEALKDGDWKKVLGHFLVRAKHLVVRWLSDNPQITSIEQVQSLQEELDSLAQQTGARHLPFFRQVDRRALLGKIAEIDRAITYLDPRDTLKYESPYGKITLPHTQHVHETLIRDLLTREVLTSDDERIVKVKKPDYLGKSQWMLKYAGLSFHANIEDLEWLHRFQSGQISVKPGDSLRVLMHEEVFYGESMEVVHVTHAVRKVFQVIPPPNITQPQILF